MLKLLYYKIVVETIYIQTSNSIEQSPTWEANRP
jgi:hypothetical protein